MISSRRRPFGHVLAALLLAGTLVLTDRVASAAPGQTGGDLGAPAAQRITSSPSGDSGGGRLASDLHDDAGLHPAPAGHEDQYRAPRDSSGRVHVLVQTSDADASRRAVEANGGAVQYATASNLDAVIPADRLLAVSDDPSVRFVSDGRQYRNNAGTVTSEGVADTGANTWLAAHRDGSGVNVAIIDVAGFQGYQNELGDELPASVVTKNFCGSNPDQVDSSFTADPHGTEVAAIVHDMAPGAGLTLICAQNDPEIVQAQDYILARNADGDPSNDISVVNASWGDPLAGRGDGSGGANTAEGVVRTLRQNNVLWTASAGNEADVHDKFVPAGPDAPSSFGPVVAWAPGNYEDGFTVAPFSSVDVQLKWDAWTGPPQDFDLYLVNINGQQVGFPSTNRQVLGAPPVEDAFVQNFTGSPVTYYAVIIRFSAAANPRFDSYVLYAPSELVDPSGSVTSPADSASAFTVGAACVATNVIEPFSGRGPTIDGRVKPDITGPDGTSQQDSSSTDPYGPANSNCTSGFTGTSASAPHVAGAVAVVKQMDPTLSASQIQQFLQGRATDAGPAGLDNSYGSGRLSLGATASAPGSGDPLGSVDHVTAFAGGLAVSGVAFDPDSAVPSAVDVSVDGNPPVRVAAVLPRADTAAAFPGIDTASHGYAASFAVPPGPHQVCVTALDAPTTPGADVLLGCANAYALPGASSRTRDVDYNGDGAADLAVLRPGSPAQQWFAATLPNQPFLYGDSGRGDIPVPADYNGDGRVEQAVFRPTSPAQWWIAGRAAPVMFGEPGDIPVVGDYNGDGIADIAVWRPGSPGRLFVDGLPNQPLLYGDSRFGDIPVPGDYNGDGITDFAVFRPTSPGQWFVNGLPSPTLFGEPGDVPVPADYNGDGRADIAIVRLSGPAEQWFVNGVGTLLFGDSRAGDVPIPADYNGDGRADIAIVRPGHPDVWFLSGIGSSAYGEAADVPVSGR